jgi:hypothetical protein
MSVQTKTPTEIEVRKKAYDSAVNEKREADDDAKHYHEEQLRAENKVEVATAAQEAAKARVAAVTAKAVVEKAIANAEADAKVAAAQADLEELDARLTQLKAKAENAKTVSTAAAEAKAAAATAEEKAKAAREVHADAAKNGDAAKSATAKA